MRAWAINIDGARPPGRLSGRCTASASCQPPAASAHRRSTVRRASRRPAAPSRAHQARSSVQWRLRQDLDQLGLVVAKPLQERCGRLALCVEHQGAERVQPNADTGCLRLAERRSPRASSLPRGARDTSDTWPLIGRIRCVCARARESRHIRWIRSEVSQVSRDRGRERRAARHSSALHPPRPASLKLSSAVFSRSLMPLNPRVLSSFPR